MDDGCSNDSIGLARRIVQQEGDDNVRLLNLQEAKSLGQPESHYDQPDMMKIRVPALTPRPSSAHAEWHL